MKIFRKITALFLATVFVLSSLGFTINKMVCLKSGKTKISLTHVKDCCPEKKSSIPVVKAQCCDIQNSSFKLTDFSVAQKHELPCSQELISFSEYSFAAVPSAVQTVSVLSFADLPPPLSGKSLLHFISILLI
ncbi:MAG: hypothetical protein J0L87_06705 [Bacteroidetes bacterium]|nr:hypothetical protein [Bacteroidota bacterium]